MSNYHPVRVWSAAQRVIHWVIAVSVLLLIPLGLLILFHDFFGLSESGQDSAMDIHAAIGFVLGAGALARIIYLFTGPQTSNWKDVVPHTKNQWALGLSTVKYYLSGFRGKAPAYFSHNPLAGLFDTVLFFFLVTQFLSGASMFLLGPEEHAHASAALEHATEAWPPEWLEIIHVIGAAAVIGFVISHFTALAAHDIVEERGLVSSMISGDKFFSDEELEELKDDIRDKTGKTPPF